jgi:hypothetical protein
VKHVNVKPIGWTKAEAERVAETLKAEGCRVENLREGYDGVWFADTDANRNRIRGLRSKIASR